MGAETSERQDEALAELGTLGLWDYAGEATHQALHAICVHARQLAVQTLPLLFARHRRFHHDIESQALQLIPVRTRGHCQIRRDRIEHGGQVRLTGRLPGRPRE